MIKLTLYLLADAALKVSPGAIGYNGPHSIDIHKILATVYMLAGMVAVLIIVIAGIMFATANGDASRIQKAKMAILGAVIGLVVIVFAFVITQFVIFKVA